MYICVSLFCRHQAKLRTQRNYISQGPRWILCISVSKLFTHFLHPVCQDTCVALQALSEYAILSYVAGVNLTISLASTNLDFQETFELNKDNKKLLQSAKVTTSWMWSGIIQSTTATLG